MAEDSQNLSRRPRRLRRNAPIRALVQETRVTVDDLAYPLFVLEGGGDPDPGALLPGLPRPPADYIPRQLSHGRPWPGLRD